MTAPPSLPHLDQRGHGVHFVEVLCDAFHQVGHRHTDGPGSVALQVDDLIGPVVHKHTHTVMCFCLNLVERNLHNLCCADREMQRLISSEI